MLLHWPFCCQGTFIICVSTRGGGWVNKIVIFCLHLVHGRAKKRNIWMVPWEIWKLKLCSLKIEGLCFPFQWFRKFHIYDVLDKLGENSMNIVDEKLNVILTYFWKFFVKSFKLEYKTKENKKNLLKNFLWLFIMQSL